MSSSRHVPPAANEAVNRGITLVCLEGNIPSKQIPREIDAAAAKFSGIRVQNYNGECGTLRWVGELGKESIWGKGLHGAVEYDTPAPGNPHMSDGIFIPFKTALAMRRDSKGTPTSPTSDGADETAEAAGVSPAPAVVNGSFVRYASCPPGTCGFAPLRHLYYETIPDAIAKVRAYFTSEKPEPYVATEMHDVMIVKFLIARQFNWDKVVLMLSNHAEWRKTAPVYNPEAVFDPGMAEFFPIGDCIGTDMEGNLLHYCRPGLAGAISPVDFVKRFGEQQCADWHLQEVLHMQDRLKQQNFVAKRYTVIYDLKNLGSVDTKVISWGKAVGQLDQDHNPEMLARAFMINAPLLFRGIYSIFQLVMDERTKDKVRVLGSDYHHEISKYIDAENLPEFAGGTDTTWLSNGGAIGKKVTVEAWAAIQEERNRAATEAFAAPGTPASPQNI